MIEGLKYHFTSEQIAKHMRDRADHHEKRAVTKEEALPKMKEALEEIKKNAPTNHLGGMSKSGAMYNVGNPDEDLERDIKDHRNKALVFRTLSEHLAPNETYVLTESDLTRLEILQVAR